MNDYQVKDLLDHPDKLDEGLKNFLKKWIKIKKAMFHLI